MRLCVQCFMWRHGQQVSTVNVVLQLRHVHGEEQADGAVYVAACFRKVAKESCPELLGRRLRPFPLD